jgi:hypothetical protein
MRPAQYDRDDVKAGAIMPVFVRRTFLLAMLFAVPPLLTWLLYFASTYLLNATSRTIDPQILFYAAIFEMLAFFFVAVLEVRARW